MHIGTLACVDRGLAANIEIISALTNWRQLHMRYFLSHFEATASRTRYWLENIVIPSPNKMLFIIYLTTGEAIGNFGICNMAATSGELDNVIRGEKVGDPRLVFYCGIALLSWMFGHLGYQNANLHVFSNNKPAMKLYSSMGFKILDSIKLTQRISPGKTEYLLNTDEGGPVDFSYLEMGISRDAFLGQHPWVRSVYVNHWQ